MKELFSKSRPPALLTAVFRATFATVKQSLMTIEHLCWLVVN